MPSVWAYSYGIVWLFHLKSMSISWTSYQYIQGPLESHRHLQWIHTFTIFPDPSHQICCSWTLYLREQWPHFLFQAWTLSYLYLITPLGTQSLSCPPPVPPSFPVTDPSTCLHISMPLLWYPSSCVPPITGSALASFTNLGVIFVKCECESI